VNGHRLRVKGWLPGRVTATCSCGYVAERLDSRGEARRLHQWHCEMRRALFPRCLPNERARA